VSDDQESKAIRELTERLLARFPRTSRAEVAGLVRACYQEFTHARIRDFVPVLVEHDAVSRLTERGRGNEAATRA
jgi:hypothetical protein